MTLTTASVVVRIGVTAWWLIVDECRAAAARVGERGEDARGQGIGGGTIKGGLDGKGHAEFVLNRGAELRGGERVDADVGEEVGGVDFVGTDTDDCGAGG